MRSSKILLLSLLACAFAFSGCTLDTEPSDLEKSSFRVDTVGGEIQNYAAHGNWNLPSQRLFNLWACIKDKAERADIVNHEFRVTAGEKSYSVRSDAQGCVHWPELVSFDIFAQPTYVKIVRELKSLGKQRGSVKFELAINPWSGVIGDEPAVVDLNKVRQVTRLYDEKDPSLALKAQSSNPVHFEINTVEYKLDIDSPNAKQDAKMRLVFKPSVVVNDMSGNVKRIPLETGTLMVWPALYRVDNGSTGEKTPLIDSLPTKEVKIVNGTVDVSYPVKLAAKIDMEKPYVLFMNVVAHDAPLYIAPFPGVYEIPKVTGLRGGTLGMASDFRSQIRTFSASKFFENVRSSEPRAPYRLDPNDKGATFVFNTVGAEQNGIPEESFMERRVSLALHVNVRWAIGLEEAAGRVFRIYAAREVDKKTGEIKSPRRKLAEKAVNSAGELEWEDQIVHGIYRKIDRYKYTLEFEDVLTGRSYFKCALVNPWDFWSTFGRDCDAVNEVPIPENEKLHFAVPKQPIVRLDSVCMARTDSAVEDLIKPDLSLEVRHRFNVSVDAKVTRFDDLRQGAQAAPEFSLRGGWWLMTIAVFRNDIAGGKVGDRDADGKLVPIATIEKTICNVTTPMAEIEMKLKELSIMDKRNYFAIQFKPLDHSRLKFSNEFDEHSSYSCTGGKIAADSPLVVDRNNDLISQPFVFAFAPRNDGCATSYANPVNLSDERVIKLINSLKNDYEDPALHNIHKAHQENLAKKAQEEALAAKQDVENGWKNSATIRGLKPYLIKNDAEIGQLPALGGRFNLAALNETLACMDQAFWADVTQVPACATPEVMERAKAICFSIVGALGQDPAQCADPLRNTLVEEKIHVYKILGSSALSGFSTSLGVNNGFAVGSFEGSDYGASESDGFSVNGGAEVGASVGVGGEKGAIKAGASLGVSAGVSGGHSWTSFNIDFTREWADSQIGVSTGTSLTNESLDVQLRIGQYRRCYTVRIKGAAEKGGYYVCGGVQNAEAAPLVRTERYYMLFNPGSSAVMVNPADDRSRWMIQFRGEKLFYYFVGKISAHLAPFHRNSTPTPIVDIIDRVRTPEVWDRILTENGSWGERFVLSTAPAEQHLYMVDETRLRDYRLDWFNPFEDFDNRHFRDQNLGPDREANANSQFDNY